MIGTLSQVPPHGNMVVTEYNGTTPDLETLYDLIGSSYVGIAQGITTFEQNGAVVPTIAAYPGDNIQLGLEINEAAMILQASSLLRQGKSTVNAQELHGNLVLGCGDAEFMTALDELIPEPGTLPPGGNRLIAIEDGDVAVLIGTVAGP